MIRLPSTRRSKLLVGLVVIIVFAITIASTSYILSNGRIRIVVDNGTKITSAKYCSDDCTNYESMSGESATVPKGEYTVSVALENGTGYIKRVSVDGLLKESTVNVKSKKYDVSPVLASSKQFILPVGNNSYLSYDPDGAMSLEGGSSTSSDNIESLAPNTIAAMNYNGNSVLVVVNNSTDDNSSNTTTTLSYDNLTDSTTSVDSVIYNINSYNVVYGKEAIYSMGSGDNDRNVYSFLPTGISSTVVPNDIDFAKNGIRPIFAASNRYISFISGNDYVSPDNINEYANSIPAVTDEKLTVYDKSFHKIQTFDLGNRNDISDISISPDSSYVVAIGSDKISAYSIKSGSKVFETPADNLGNTSIFWKDDGSFVYQMGTGGIYLSDLNKQESYSLIDNNLLRITDISSIVDDKIYLTAFPNKDDNYDRTKPDGYVIDLDTKIPVSTEINKESIVRSLPLKTTLYTISYHFQKDNFVVDITSPDGYYGSAIEKLYDLGYDPAEYEINFNNYSNPFEEKVND